MSKDQSHARSLSTPKSTTGYSTICTHRSDYNSHGIILVNNDSERFILN